MAGSTQERNERKDPHVKPEKTAEWPVFELGEASTFVAVSKRGGMIHRTAIGIDRFGNAQTLGIETHEPLSMDEAEGNYTTAALDLFRTLDELAAARRLLGTHTDTINQEMDHDQALTQYRSALGDLLDTGYEPQRIGELNRQIATQVSNMGLSHIGEPTPKEKSDIPVLDREVRKELRKRELAEQRSKTPETI